MPSASIIPYVSDVAHPDYVGNPTFTITPGDWPQIIEPLQILTSPTTGQFIRSQGWCETNYGQDYGFLYKVIEGTLPLVAIEDQKQFFAQNITLTGNIIVSAPLLLPGDVIHANDPLGYLELNAFVGQFQLAQEGIFLLAAEDTLVGPDGNITSAVYGRTAFPGDSSVFSRFGAPGSVTVSEFFTCGNVLQFFGAYNYSPGHTFLDDFGAFLLDLNAKPLVLLSIESLQINWEVADGDCTGHGGTGGGNPGGSTVAGRDVAQAIHPHAGFFIASSQADGIVLSRHPHSDFDAEASFYIAGGMNLREPRLAIEPYSSLLSCIFRGGTGKHAGDDDGHGNPLPTDDPFQLFRRYSLDDGATWTGDPPDTTDSAALSNLVPIPGTDGMKHTREVFNHASGERLHFYNDASTVDANGNPTGQGLIQVDIYDISNAKIGTFPEDGNGIGAQTADDNSFDALYIADATTFLSCVFTVGGNQVRYLSFDDGRTWLDASA